MLQVLFVLAGCTQQVSHEVANEQAIRQVLLDTWDSPQKNLVVDPIVIAGEYAIADWTQAARGGRALVHLKGSVWNVELCAGDYLRDASNIQDAGAPAESARALAIALAEKEKKISPDRLARLASFAGTMRMQAASAP